MNFTTLLSKATTLLIMRFFFSLHFLIGEEHMIQTNQKNRFQEPKPPFPYFIEEVSYGSFEISLSGTLTLPITTATLYSYVNSDGTLKALVVNYSKSFHTKKIKNINYNY